MSGVSSHQTLQHIRDYPGVARIDGTYSLGIYVQKRNWARFTTKPKYKRDLDESRLILALKDGEHDPLQYFCERLMPLVHLYPVIAAPPPSKLGQENSGIRSLVKHVVDKSDSIRPLISQALQGREDVAHHTKQIVKHMSLTPGQLDDGSRCLERIKAVPKHGSGERSKEVHLKSIRVRHQALIEQKRVLLLDDVVTTGDTMEACKLRLEEAGASQVTMLALLRTYFRGKVER